MGVHLALEFTGCLVGLVASGSSCSSAMRGFGSNSGLKFGMETAGLFVRMNWLWRFAGIKPLVAAASSFTALNRNQFCVCENTCQNSWEPSHFQAGPVVNISFGMLSMAKYVALAIT